VIADWPVAPAFTFPLIVQSTPLPVGPPSFPPKMRTPNTETVPAELSMLGAGMSCVEPPLAVAQLFRNGPSVMLSIWMTLGLKVKPSWAPRVGESALTEMSSVKLSPAPAFFVAGDTLRLAWEGWRVLVGVADGSTSGVRVGVAVGLPAAVIVGVGVIVEVAFAGGVGVAVGVLVAPDPWPTTTVPLLMVGAIVSEAASMTSPSVIVIADWPVAPAFTFPLMVASTPLPVGPPSLPPAIKILNTETVPAELSMLGAGISVVEPPLAVAQLFRNGPSVMLSIWTTLGLKVKPSWPPRVGESALTEMSSVKLSQSH
jgi:hypothetical protein